MSSPILVSFLCNLFQLCFDQAKVPLKWCETIILPVHKKGDKLKPGNYRPIALSQSFLKLFTSLFAFRLSKWLTKNKRISEYQAGFMPKLGCRDHIFTLSSFIHLRLAKKKKLYACFIDLSQAFDSIPHDRLWEKLEALGIPEERIKLLMFIYRNSVVQVKSGDNMTDSINVKRGVLQGECLSPLLFNIYIINFYNALLNMVQPV